MPTNKKRYPLFEISNKAIINKKKFEEILVLIINYIYQILLYIYKNIAMITAIFINSTTS